MCDANDYAVRAVLRQRKDKHFQPIHYTSKTMNEAQENYTNTKRSFMLLSSHSINFEFNIKIRDKKGSENLTVDHLSRHKNPDLEKLTRAEFQDLFPEEQLMMINDKSDEPWSFTVIIDMKSGEIELCNEEGNEFIVNKQRVKPYQKDISEFDADDDITLDDEG
ncbi:reverse transcriptase domain-containing protein [Tanacetum coccineum]